jgi:hypothetical protein
MKIEEFPIQIRVCTLFLVSVALFFMFSNHLFIIVLKDLSLNSIQRVNIATNSFFCVTFHPVESNIFVV